MVAATFANDLDRALRRLGSKTKSSKLAAALGAIPSTEEFRAVYTTSHRALVLTTGAAYVLDKGFRYKLSNRVDFRDLVGVTARAAFNAQRVYIVTVVFETDNAMIEYIAGVTARPELEGSFIDDLGSGIVQTMSDIRDEMQAIVAPSPSQEQAHVTEKVLYELSLRLDASRASTSSYVLAAKWVADAYWENYFLPSELVAYVNQVWLPSARAEIGYGPGEVFITEVEPSTPFRRAESSIPVEKIDKTELASSIEHGWKRGELIAWQTFSEDGGVVIISEKQKNW